MSILKIRVRYDDVLLDDDEEEKEVEGSTLIECVSNCVDMTVDELKDKIKSGKWSGGGCWIERNNKIIFDSDVTRTIFSI